MQEKESIIVVLCKLKIPSRAITVRHHSTSLVMPNSYPYDIIFNLHLTTIEDPYNLIWICTVCPDLSVQKLKIITVDQEPMSW